MLSKNDSPLAALSVLAPEATDVRPAGRIETSVRAMLFDVYGTLLISASGEIGTVAEKSNPAEKLKPLFQRYEIAQAPEAVTEALADATLHRHARMKAEGTDFPEIVIEAIWQSVLGWQDPVKIRAFALEFELLVNPVWPMPHLHALFAVCRRHQIAMGIISNAQFYTQPVLEGLLDQDLVACGFDPRLIFLSFRFGVAKPSLKLFELAVKRLESLNIGPGQALYVGNDMRNDIFPAHQVGFQTALFAGDARSLRLRAGDPCCATLAPDLVITDLIQLANLLDKASNPSMIRMTKDDTDSK
jgi:putative hydrolase of the HAD superfamily